MREFLIAARRMAASNPMPDGWVEAVDPIAAMRAGRTMRVPVLAGHTRDETKQFSRITSIRANARGRLAFSQAMRSSPGAFVHAGAPQHPALGQHWPAWPGRLVFDADDDTARISVR